MKNLFLIVSIICFISCSSDDDNNVNNEPVTLEFSEIKNGLAGNDSESFQGYIIRNQTQLEDFTLLVHPNFLEDISDLNINFNESTLIGVISDIQPDTGHIIHITDVIEYENECRVQSEIVNSGSGFTVLSQSFALVKIPFKNKPFAFY